MQTTIIGLQTPAIGLEAYAEQFNQMLTTFDSDVIGPGVESWDDLGKAAEWVVQKMRAAKEWILNTFRGWMDGYKKWNAKSWLDLPEETQKKLVKQSHLAYFYYNPQDISLLEDIVNHSDALMSYTKSHAQLDDTKVLAFVKSIAVPMTKLVYHMGGAVNKSILTIENSKDTLRQLSTQFMSLLKAYKPDDNAKGHPESVVKIITLLERKKKLLDSAGKLLQEVGLESPVESDYGFLEIVCLAIFYYIVFISLGAIYGLITIIIFANIYGDYKETQRERQFEQD